jgi:capsular polysaccharide biosynthesis protein
VPAWPAPKRELSSTPAPQPDLEAEQEVDFGRYWRLIGNRWWVPIAGLVVGAVVGYLIALGGNQVFKATATLYLGQPYTASGNVQLQAAQTNPSSVKVVAHSESVIARVASECKAKPSLFRGGISTQSVAGNIAKNGQTPLVSITVQAKKRRLASCAANGLAREVIARVSAFASQKINNFSAQITNDERNIEQINSALESSALSATDKLIVQIRLAQAQTDKLQTSQLLLQAKQVEAPSVLTGAASQKVTARSRRNTVVVAALIGLILGALAALLWDGLAARLRRG